MNNYYIYKQIQKWRTLADVGGQWAFGMLYLCIVNEDKLRKGENDALSAVKRRFLLCNAMSSFF